METRIPKVVIFEFWRQISQKNIFVLHLFAEIVGLPKKWAHRPAFHGVTKSNHKNQSPGVTWLLQSPPARPFPLKMTSLKLEFFAGPRKRKKLGKGGTHFLPISAINSAHLSVAGQLRRGKVDVKSKTSACRFIRERRQITDKMGATLEGVTLGTAPLADHFFKEKMISQKGEKTENGKNGRTVQRETLLVGAKTSPKIWQAFPAPRQCRGVSPEFNLLRQEESTATEAKRPPKNWAAFPAPRQLQGVSPEFNLLRQEVPYQYKWGWEQRITRHPAGPPGGPPDLSEQEKGKTRKHTKGLSPIRGAMGHNRTRPFASDY